jgi:hypothetical protein
VVLDIDGPQGEATAESLGLLEEPTLEVITGRGRHRYYRHPGGHIGNAPLGPKLDVRADVGYVVLPPSIHYSGRTYQWNGKLEDVADLPLDIVSLLTSPSEKKNAPVVEGSILDDQRNLTLTSLAGSMRRRGMTAREIEVALLEINRQRCEPPLPEAEVRKISQNIAKYDPAEAPLSEPDEHDHIPREWPAPPNPAAFQGLAGDFVRAHEPHTEADSVALLGQFIVAVGNLIGRIGSLAAIGHNGPYCRVEADQHYMNLFALLVGPTGKGRKGTS